MVDGLNFGKYALRQDEFMVHVGRGKKETKNECIGDDGRQKVKVQRDGQYEENSSK